MTNTHIVVAYWPMKSVVTDLLTQFNTTVLQTEVFVCACATQFN